VTRTFHQSPAEVARQKSPLQEQSTTDSVAIRENKELRALLKKAGVKF
jgi:hypothetical protein